MNDPQNEPQTCPYCDQPREDTFPNRIRFKCGSATRKEGHRTPKQSDECKLRVNYSKLVVDYCKMKEERDAARARIATLEAEHEDCRTVAFKARDILQCGHIDKLVGTLQTLWTRYNDAQARIATLEAAHNQQPLEKPDRPGWWWMWCKRPDNDGYWTLEYVEEPQIHYGQYVYATPPPVPVMSEKEGLP